MATSRAKKEGILRELDEKLANFKSAVFVNYAGVNAEALGKLRVELRKEGVDLKVAKKTLLDIAFKKHNLNVQSKSLAGQVALAIGYKDEVAPAKIVYKFIKEAENLRILAGFLGKEFIGGDMVEALAKLPSYEELLAKMMGSMQAPISGFVNVLTGNIRGLVQVLNAISQKN